jgi:hypothetical protein
VTLLESFERPKIVRLGIRWTIGDVSQRGFEALRLSILGARNVFGPAADYVVCVNTVSVRTVKERVGRAARLVDWRDATHQIPLWLSHHLDSGMAEGVAWKLAPVRLFEDRHSLELDNDVILWRMPDSIRAWLDEGDSLLIAEDVVPAYGQFAPFCGPAPRNSGIRGFPPGFDAEAKLRAILETAGVRLCSELDEQGLQVALAVSEQHRAVTLDEVSICGYFRPHQLQLGSSGAHFVGVNAKKLAYEWNGRSGEQYAHSFWDWTKPAVVEKLGILSATPPSVECV